MKTISSQVQEGEGAKAPLSQPNSTHSDEKIGWLYTTTASREEALRLGHTLVEEHLLACANILENMHAIYRWKGSIETAQECVLIGKTSSTLVTAAANRLKVLHSYECPCILTLPAQAANVAFAEWVRTNVKAEVTADTLT